MKPFFNNQSNLALFGFVWSLSFSLLPAKGMRTLGNKIEFIPCHPQRQLPVLGIEQRNHGTSKILEFGQLVNSCWSRFLPVTSLSHPVHWVQPLGLRGLMPEIKLCNYSEVFDPYWVISCAIFFRIFIHYCHCRQLMLITAIIVYFTCDASLYSSDMSSRYFAQSFILVIITFIWLYFPYWYVGLRLSIPDWSLKIWHNLSPLLLNGLYFPQLCRRTCS